MKRGITINLGILFILLILFALPWIALFAIQQAAGTSGCQLTPALGQSETCQSLYSLTLLIGYGMIAYYPIIAAITVFSGAMVLLAGLLSDVIYALLDPRVRVT